MQRISNNDLLYAESFLMVKSRQATKTCAIVPQLGTGHVQMGTHRLAKGKRQHRVLPFEAAYDGMQRGARA